jgi:hypothetical protein
LLRSIGSKPTFLAWEDTLCEQVFHCLLRLQAAHPDAAQREKQTLSRWLSLLDFLSKGIIAGQKIDEHQFKEAFIA